MAEKDLGKNLENIEEGVENLKNKEFRLFGIKMTAMTVSATIAFLGSIIGMFYSGFVMYQKIESIANLDVDAFDQRMQVMETKMVEMQDGVGKTVEYSRDIKNGLQEDILRIEQVTDRTEDTVRKTIDDVKDMISAAETRFEDKRDSLRQQVERDTKELEESLNDKIQKALNNPLAN